MITQERFGPRIMKLHRELGYGEQRKPIVF